MNEKTPVVYELEIRTQKGCPSLLKRKRSTNQQGVILQPLSMLKIQEGVANAKVLVITLTHVKRSQTFIYHYFIVK